MVENAARQMGCGASTAYRHFANPFRSGARLIRSQTLSSQGLTSQSVRDPLGKDVFAERHAVVTS
jgi:hypothetical protein